VVHAADLTGAEIERTLLAKVLAHPNIAVYESHFATDLVTEAVGHATWCLGCDSFERATGREVRFPRTGEHPDASHAAGNPRRAAPRRVIRYAPSRMTHDAWGTYA
jgi:hypothetical protein